MPNLSVIGSKVGTLHWEAEYSGYTLIIDQGLGGPSNLVITDCSLSNFRLTPKEGGTVVTKFDAESPDISEASFGRLAKLKSREVKMQLTAPQIEQEDLAGSKRPKATPASAPVAAPAAAPAEAPADTGQAAETVFAEQHGGKAPGAGEADLAAEAESGGVVWPFPTPVTARADDGSAEQAELEKGMAASMAAAGLHPKAARRPRRAAGGAVE